MCRWKQYHDVKNERTSRGEAMIDHRFESIGHGVWCIARLVDRSIVGDSGSGTGKLIYPGQDTGQRIINGRGWLLEHSKRWTRRGVVL